MARWFHYSVLIVASTCVLAQATPQVAGKTESEQPQNAAAQPARASTLTAITLEGGAAQVRLVLDPGAPERYTTGLLQDPDRIYIDLESTRPGARVPRSKTVNIDPIREIRVGFRKGNITRVVLDLASPAAYSVSTDAGNIVVTLQPQIASTRQALPSKVRPDSSTVLPALLKSAQAGDAAAQFALANAYFQGSGVRADPAEAVNWYRRAALQGHTGAQVRLAFAYLNGLGTRQDDTEAVRWFREAAAKGDLTGEYNLGAAYLHGRGVPVDFVESATWLRRAADRELPEAQYALGTLYANGRGVPRDNSAAQTWLRRAAEHNLPRAQLALGKLYLSTATTGTPGAGTRSEAAVWIERAARRDLPEAQLFLAQMFRDGLGVARDPVAAYAWFALAASRDTPRAREELKAMATTMTPVQIIAAQRQQQVLASGLASK
jgi:uncharacterized protein